MGIVLWLHKQKKGLCLPSFLSPIQVVIVPYHSKQKSCIAESREVYEDIKSVARVHLDDSEDFLPNLFERYESYGVPLRVEVYPKEYGEGTVIVSLRTRDNKLKIFLSDLSKQVPLLLKQVDEDLRGSAQEVFVNRQERINTLDEFKNSDSSKVRIFGLCTADSCRQKVESLQGGEVLGRMVTNILESCVVCGNEGFESCYSRRH